MTEEPKSATASSWISLFRSAVEFDRPVVLERVRHFVKSHKSEQTKTLLKGYSRPGKISDQELERRIVSTFKSKGMERLSGLMFKLSFKDHFFGLAQDIADWVYHSAFKPSADDRLMLAWAYASFQSGWTPELLINSLILGFPFPEDFLEKHSELPSALVETAHRSFCACLTTDATKAWRNNFPFGPEEVFSDPKGHLEGVVPQVWNEVRACIVDKDDERLPLALNRIAFQENGDVDAAAEAAIDLVLLGIDLSEADMVAQGMDRIRTVMLKTTISQKRILTVLLLGSAYLKHGWEEFLVAFPEAVVMEGDPCTLGFVGSLFYESGRLDYAIRFFYAAFQDRKSPLAWPLDALCRIDERCNETIRKIIAADEIPFSIGREMGLSATEALHAHIPLANYDLLTLIRSLRDQDFGQSAMTEKRIEGGVKDLAREAADQPSLASWPDIPPDLSDLVSLYNEIAEKEVVLGDAQDRREYATVADAAAKLVTAWTQVEVELNRLISVLPGRLHDAFDVPALIDKRQLVLLKETVARLSQAYSDKRKRDKEQLETEIRAFRARLKTVQLDKLWPKEKVDRLEFERVKKELELRLTREEKLHALRKGVLDSHRFEKEFAEPQERESLVLEVLGEFAQGKIDLTPNLIEIVDHLKWGKKSAAVVLGRVLSGITKLSQSGNMEQTFTIEIVIPFIADCAQRAGQSPLKTFVENPELSHLLHPIVDSKSIKSVKPFLRLLSSEIDSDFIETADFVSLSDDSLHLLRQLLVRLDDFMPGVPASRRIKLLSQWVLRMLSVHNGAALSAELEILEKLRDYLDQMGRLPEAVLLVAALWRELGNDKILDGFEKVLLRVIVDMMDKGGESRSLAKMLVQDPGWLIKEPETVAMFLYLCHVGDFQAIVDAARYSYFQEFKEAEDAFPVLVGEFFLKVRFGRDSVTRREDADTADYVMALQVLRDLEHDLRRSSMYRTWGPAAEYQTIFNNKIEGLREKVLEHNSKTTGDIRRELEDVNPHEWIEECDRDLKVKAKYQAHEAMERYIRGQVSRLLSLHEIRTRIKATDMLPYLHAKSIPLRDRLQNESFKIGKEPFMAAKVYQLVLEAMK